MSEQKQEQYDRIDKFHAHLDDCKQCRDHPFDLCPDGAKLLKEAATGVKEQEEVIEQERYVTIRFEPSKELSALCGFPYYVDRRFTVRELLEQGIINEDDMERLMQGVEIHKSIRVEQLGEPE